jgi:Ca-activated chloride channel family protein
MRLMHEGWLEWLWLLPVLLGLLGWAITSARMARLRFVSNDASKRLARPFGLVRAVARAVLLGVGVVAIVVALARPVDRARSAPVLTYGRDVCFVIDVSRSMLAEDLAPNRLERSKIWIRDALGVLSGDRVALVAFAGDARVICPLTHDYGFFATVVDDLRPETVTSGGTLIGDAMRTALDRVFLDEDAARFQDIILITDGEDQGSLPVAAAEALGKRDIRLIALGIGDATEGARIPITENGELRYMTDTEGEVVVSRLDEQTLRDMVAQTPGGRYYSVKTGDVRLDEIYRTLIGEAEQRVLQTTDTVVYREWFPMLLGLAAMALAVEVLLGRR